MAIIHLLSDNIISKIAAGEVIERPASVIKELVENSIDAGSTKIKVITKKAGKTLIKVVDNGTGMSKDDLVMCGKRYATSKIMDINDLYNISSLGFRGEALASMAAMAQLTVSSRFKNSENAWQVIFDHNGNMNAISPANITNGTVISLSSLFSEIPARLKFLKNDESEDKNNLKTLYYFILSNPEIHFEFSTGKSNIIFPCTKLLERIAMVFGNDVSANMIPLQYSDSEITVSGYITKQTYTKKTKEMQYIFVNKRYVRSKEITDFVYKGYNKFGKLFLDRHPCFVLSITVAPETIDVNIHPAKLNIKFIGTTGSKVSDAVYNTLKSHDEILSAQLSQGPTLKTKHIYFEKGSQKTLGLQSKQFSGMLKPLETSDGWRKLLPVNVLGIINKTYILGEDKLGMLIIDQHAAEERVNFEKIMKHLRKEPDIQTLLSPVTVVASPEESEIINHKIKVFIETGFEIKPYGVNTFVVRSVPSFLSDLSSEQLSSLVLDMVHNINLPKDRLYNRIATKACKKSVKAGDYISKEYASTIVTKLDKCENPYTCPHGRPTIIRFTWSDLETKFKRRA